MRRPVLLALLVCPLFGAQCYEQDSDDMAASAFLEVEAAQASAPADGYTRVPIVATLKGDVKDLPQTVVFAADIGTLTTTALAGGQEPVSVETYDSATAWFVPPRDATEATVRVTLAGVDGEPIKVRITLEPPNIDEIVRFVNPPLTLEADGATDLLLEVAIDPLLVRSDQSVKMRAWSGSFPFAGMEGAVAAASSTIEVVYRPPTTTGTTRLTATIDGFTAEAMVALEPAAPHAVRAVIGPFLQVAADAAADVEAHLSRASGSVSAGFEVTYASLDSTGAPVGDFRLQTASDATGKSTAKFVPGATTYLGPVRIAVSVPAYGLSDTTIVNLIP